MLSALAKRNIRGILRFMFLSHQTIEKYIDEGKILIEPDFDKKNIRPVGIRIHLAKHLLLPEPNQVVSLTVAQELKNLGNFKIRLNFKDPVAMMLFAELKDPVTQKLQTQYGGGQSKATPPNLRFRTGDDK